MKKTITLTPKKKGTITLTKRQPIVVPGYARNRLIAKKKKKGIKNIGYSNFA